MCSHRSPRAHVHLPFQEGVGGFGGGWGGDLCAPVVRAAALRSVRARGLNFSAAAVGSPPGYQLLQPAEGRLDGSSPPNPRWSRRNDAAVEPKRREKRRSKRGREEQSGRREEPGTIRGKSQLAYRHFLMGLK